MLSKQAKDALDEIATQLKNQHGYVIEVQGFSSGQGQTVIANSRKIADSVVRYLVFNHEVPAYRIYVIGMGNARVAKRTSGTRCLLYTSNLQCLEISGDKHRLHVSRESRFL